MLRQRRPAAVLAAVPGWFVWQTMQLENELSEAVQVISGRPDATVNCQGFLRGFRLDNNLGEVQRSRDGTMSTQADLRDSVCDNISSYLDSDKSNPSLDQVIAVHVLTHEAMHVAGDANERTTECNAMQADKEMAMQLGATAEQAQALATRYAAEVYPRMPNGYKAPECREDGAWDHTPDDGVWP